MMLVFLLILLFRLTCCLLALLPVVLLLTLRLKTTGRILMVKSTSFHVIHRPKSQLGHYSCRHMKPIPQSMRRQLITSLRSIPQLSLQIQYINGLPERMRSVQGIDVALEGNLSRSVRPDRATNSPVAVWTVPSPTGSELSDSSFDLLRIGYSQKETHFLVKLVTDPTGAQSATISKLL